MMTIQKVRKLARTQGLSPGKFQKIELIRMIQRREGNFDCFATAVNGYCDQSGCLWRDDCFSSAKNAMFS
jgi:hypothetical protein